MFKRTNKMWKGIAVALAVCMLPTVALASDSINTITVGTDWVTYDAAENTVTVTGTIGADGVGNSDADVTILAVRSAKALTTLEGVDIQAQAVYIDQESFENGAFTFSFIPRKNVSGKVINVFVGGKDVLELKHAFVETALPAGTLTLKDECKDLVDNNGVTLVYDVVDSAGWADILEGNAVLKNGDAVVDGVDFDLNDEKTVLTATVPQLKGETASYTLEVKHADYADATATGTAVVTAPTVKDVALVTAPVATKNGHYTDASGYDAADPNADQKWAKYFITPSTAALTNGSSISWTLTDATGAEVTAAEGTYELKRYADKSMTYTLVGEVTNGTYVIKTTDPFTFTVGQLGAAGVNVTVNGNFRSINASKAGVMTLKQGDATYPLVREEETQNFKATTIIPGTYTLIIERPGYVTREVEVVIGTGDTTITSDKLPKMIAGQVDGKGTIDVLDISKIGEFWGKPATTEGFNAADLDGSGSVDVLDISVLGEEWGWPNN